MIPKCYLFQANWPLVQFLKADTTYLNKAANKEFLDIYLKSVFKKILLIKKLLF